MLVLSRKKNERLIIDSNIVVTVLDLNNGIVRLGIEAPRDIAIHREEVYERIQQEKAGEVDQWISWMAREL